MSTMIEAENLNDTAAALCAMRATWGQAVTGPGSDVMFRGSDEALSMVYNRAQEEDAAAFEAYRALTALFYALRAMTAARGGAGHPAFRRFARHWGA